MSNIKRITITDPTTHEIRRYFPDQRLQYWDASVTQDRGCYWYYQMHTTAVIDQIYAAGRKGYEVKMELEGGADIVLQQ